MCFPMQIIHGQENLLDKECFTQKQPEKGDNKNEVNEQTNPCEIFEFSSLVTVTFFVEMELCESFLTVSYCTHRISRG